MKNKHFTIVALAAAALATSCASEDIAEPQKQKQNQGEPKTVTLTASVNEAQTRVGMTKNDGKASFYWQSDDKILVQTVNDGTYSGTPFSIETITDGKTATFTGEVTGSVHCYAVYPYSENQKHSFTSEKELTYVLPSTYTNYTPSTKIFGTDAGYSTNMPMLGTISDNSIAFKHLGGLAVIRIDNMPATSGTLTVTADQQLSGDFTVNDLSAGEPKLTTATASGNNTVTFNFSNVTKGATGVFYLPLATGNYTGVKITVASTDDSFSSMVNYGDLDVARAGVTAIPLYKTSDGTSLYAMDADGKYHIDGHKFVDLGLSVLWAETNIGASKASGYGNYYQWGETEIDSDYGWLNYKLTENGGSTFTRYTTKDATLDEDDDAATVNWGSSCRMPTEDEFEELLSSDKCTWTWETVDNVNGYTVTSNVDSYADKSIFLPASGYRNGKGNDTFDANEIGYYWSSTLATDIQYAYFLAFVKDTHQIYDYVERYKGLTVRAVATKPE